MNILDLLAMPKDYWHCDKCNGNFDYGEPCDCKEEELLTQAMAHIIARQINLIKENAIYGANPGPVLKVSETLQD